jgi:hypothetical protein
MSERFDFHTHTIASDGSLTPTELVRAAAANGVTAFALTDHDTVDGIAEARAEADLLGVELIAGIEISVNEEDGARSLHVLGLASRPKIPSARGSRSRVMAARAGWSPACRKSASRSGCDVEAIAGGAPSAGHTWRARSSTSAPAATPTRRS